MTSNPEFGNVTGTRDKDYDIIWFTEACLSNVLRLETYIEDAALARDDELAEFFRRAQHGCRDIAVFGDTTLAIHSAASGRRRARAMNATARSGGHGTDPRPGPGWTRCRRPQPIKLWRCSNGPEISTLSWTRPSRGWLMTSAGCARCTKDSGR